MCGVGTAAAESSADRQLTALIDESWEFDMREDPLRATATGDHRFGDRLPALSLADIERRAAQKATFLERLEAIDRIALLPQLQTNYDIMRRMLKDELAEHEFAAHLIPITNRSGFHIEFPELRRRVPLDTVLDVRKYIARLAAFADYANDHIILLRAGIESGRTLPAVVLEDFQRPIEAHMVDDAEESLFFEPFRKLPAAIPAGERERLAEAGRRAIRQGIVPGYRQFLKFMREEYVPACRPTIGASELPDGRAFYRHRVRHFTTLDLSPEEVHATGQSEVQRIRQEMKSLVEKIGFEGDLAAFLQHLRTEPEFYAKTSEELMKETALVLKRMDGELPRLFGRLPRMPYGIRPVPAYIAPRTTTAYYSPPPGDGTRAGYYYVNTYDLASRPLYGVEALSLHEAVPGHHLQIALQQELEDLPKFRRFGGFTVFVEGWALYAERLGLEVGFYEDPYRDFGRLTYEMWRACRLVVDTGIHYFGWTRQQAIDFLAANSALSMHNIRAEVDRYIAWPGQALAYKIGELKIRELRSLAEQRLGEKFDVRAFHDEVLGSGTVPLDVLEKHVQAWIDEVLGDSTK